MGLKKFAVQNKGMSQDVSVSKETQEYAFENYNIRIQATDDNTLLSVTNIKGPRQCIFHSWTAGDEENDSYSLNLAGTPIGHCIAGDYVVIFLAKNGESGDDSIIRIKPTEDYTYSNNIEYQVIEAVILASGNLNFHTDKKLNALYYYESQKVQKVYWVDGWYSDDEIEAAAHWDIPKTLTNNFPRVINILRENAADSPAEIQALSIFPAISTPPTVTVNKIYDQVSQLPAGVIQYFISYYNYNSAETLLTQATPLYYIDYETKGAAPDATGVCALELTINNLDTSYEYVRIYSAIRTSVNTSPIVSIVKDIKIPASGPVTLIDNGINQENVSSELLYYIGGSPLYAAVIEQKDNTAFYGNIKDAAIYFSDSELATIESALHYNLTDDQDGSGICTSKILSVNKKTVQIGPSSFGTYYTYRKQDEDSKTFKAGEIYRFAIQFQNTVGAWSDPIWCGDLEMPAQSFLEEDNPNLRIAEINNVVTLLSGSTPRSLNSILAGTSALTILNSKDVCNYRILMADAESSNGRKIAAQGLVSPTMFNIKQRYNNSPYALASWITRPVNVEKAPTHHLEPLNDPVHINAELNSELNPYGHYTVPFHIVPTTYNVDNDDYYIIEVIATKDSGDYHTKFVLATVNSPSLVNGGYNADDYIKIVDIETATYSSKSDACDALQEFIYRHRLSTLVACEDMFDNNGNAFSGLRNAITSYYYGNYGTQFWYPTKAAVEHPDVSGRYKDDGGQALDESDENAAKNIYSGKWIPTVYGANGDAAVYFTQFNANSAQICNDDFFGRGTYCLSTKLRHFFAGVLPGSTQCYIGCEKINYPSKDNYYIDTSTVTFNSPEVDNNSVIFDSKKYQFRIIGNANIGAVYSDVSLMTSSGLASYAGIFKEPIDLYRHQDVTDISSLDTPYFNSDYIYTDYGWEHPAGLNPANGLAFPGKKQAYYKMFMWHKQGSILGVDKRTSWYPPYKNDDDQIITDPYPSELEDKTTFNQKISTSCIYSYGDSNTNVDYGEVSCKSLNESDAAGIDIQSEYKLYYGNYDNLIASNNMLVLRKWNVDDVLDIDDDTIAVPGLCRIQFKSSPHVVFNLGTTTVNGSTYKNILPFDNGSLSVGDVKVCDVNAGKDKIADNWSGSRQILKVSQDLVPGTDYNLVADWDRNILVDKYASPVKLMSTDPTVFIGELYSNIPYSNLYGGYSEDSLKKLTWIPISDIKSTSTSVTKTYGDTYYQMYDCLKTYPVLDTESFENKVVDITSVMIETHYNIDERYDNNRAAFNIMTRPSNFNLYNLVYSQKDNLFSYNINETKLSSNEYPQQINWTFVKNYLGDVDTWCSPLMMNLTNVKHKLTQLVNFNNSLIALTEHSIEKVNYNEKTFMQTDSEYVEVANSGKIDGTVELQYPYGTYNQTYLITEKGLYFIDDNEKSIIRINLDGGVTKIALSKMDSWMKNTIVQGTFVASMLDAEGKLPFILDYDPIHKDIYIAYTNDKNEDECLIYNEFLESFTSFTNLIPRQFPYFINNGDLYSIFLNDYNRRSIIASKMFAGEYNIDAYGSYKNYYMQFRLNPAPYSDKTFTNIEFNADLGTDEWLNQNTHRDDTSIIDANSNPTREYPIEPVVPFTTIRAWNEYQDTLDKTLQYNKGYNTYGMGNVSAKFRTWRAEIPREWCKRDVTKTIDGVQQTVTEVNPHNYYGRNRIRNPWIHLKLSNNNPKDTKMEFHNMLVQYLE